MSAAIRQPGLMQRLVSAGRLIVRGSLPLTEETIQRYFKGINGLSTSDGGDGYSKVAVVYACVRKLGTSLSGLPLTISTADDEVLESGPLVQLAECPNPRMTSRAFWMATSAWLDLFGLVHWVFTLDAGGRPIEIYPVSPLQMKPVRDKRTGEVLAWKYRAAGSIAGQEEMLPLEQVHTIIDHDFTDADPLKPLSPRHAVAMAISQLYKADVANEASLDNGVEPGSVLIHKNGPLSDPQRNSLRSELTERHAGPRNRRRPLILYGEWDWRQIATSYKDMEFSTLKKMSRADVCMAFNVPGPLVSVYEDSNYAHAAAAAEDFWTNTMMPRAARLAEEFTISVLDRYKGDRSLKLDSARRSKLDWRCLVSRSYTHAKRAARRSDRKFYAWFDSSQVPEVQRGQLALTEQLSRWHSMGVPLNQLLRASDAPFEEVPYGNVGMKPIGIEAYGADTLDTIDHPPGSDEETGLIPSGDKSRVGDGEGDGGHTGEAVGFMGEVLATIGKSGARSH